MIAMALAMVLAMAAAVAMAVAVAVALAVAAVIGDGSGLRCGAPRAVGWAQVRAAPQGLCGDDSLGDQSGLCGCTVARS